MRFVEYECQFRNELVAVPLRLLRDSVRLVFIHSSTQLLLTDSLVELSGVLTRRSSGFVQRDSAKNISRSLSKVAMLFKMWLPIFSPLFIYSCMSAFESFLPPALLIISHPSRGRCSSLGKNFQ